MFHWSEGDPMYHEYPGFVVFIGASIIGFWYWCTDQHIVQRVLGQTKGEDNTVVMKRARRGTICAGYFKLLPVFMFLIPGMIAAALAANPAKYGLVMNNTDAAFALMVKDVLPAGVKGIVTIGFISALVTSLAAFFNSCATLFTEDFYKPLRAGKSEAHYVLVGRLATVAVVLLGLAWMPIMMSMVDANHDEYGYSLQLSAEHPVIAGTSHGSRVLSRYFLQEDHSYGRTVGTYRWFRDRYAPSRHQCHYS